MGNKLESLRPIGNAARSVGEVIYGKTEHEANGRVFPYTAIGIVSLAEGGLYAPAVAVVATIFCIAASHLREMSQIRFRNRQTEQIRVLRDSR